MVEDERELAEILAAELRGEGYEVVTAINGLQALELIRKWSDSIDLLIADVVLPQVSGFALAHKLRKRAPNSKILLMSGYGQIFREGTGFPVLAKPISPDDLIEKVQQLFHQGQPSEHEVEPPPED